MTGKIKEEVEKVNTTTLKKETTCTRGVDYRKATILFSNVFDKVCPDDDLHHLFNTTLQIICEIMYSRETSRCQKAVLRLHNLTIQHAVQCIGHVLCSKEHFKGKNVWKLLSLTFSPCLDSLPGSCPSFNQHRASRADVQHLQWYNIGNLKSTS